MDRSRVLIVDDIEENLKVLTETLTNQGFHPLQAKSGEKALMVAEKAQPDLILLDIKMPGMDGYETIVELKKNPSTCDIPVIFISALNQIEDKVKGFESGAVDYVSKPFQKEEVIARVSTHIKLRQAQREIEHEQAKSEKLLNSILPDSVARDLKDKGSSEPQNFKNVSILFTDFVSFTNLSETLDPRTLINELNEMFTEFDSIMEKHDCERIKTIGDAYLAVSGMAHPRQDHAEKLVKAAKEIISYLDNRNKTAELKWEVRIGIHSGDIVGGIVGTKKYIYDIFGDSVNMASRMEFYSDPMKINISQASFDLISNTIPCTKRNPIEVKGKGKCQMYYVD